MTSSHLILCFSSPHSGQPSCRRPVCLAPIQYGAHLQFLSDQLISRTTSIVENIGKVARTCYLALPKLRPQTKEQGAKDELTMALEGLLEQAPIETGYTWEWHKPPSSHLLAELRPPVAAPAPPGEDWPRCEPSDALGRWFKVLGGSWWVARPCSCSILCWEVQ